MHLKKAVSDVSEPVKSRIEECSVEDHSSLSDTFFDAIRQKTIKIIENMNYTEREADIKLIISPQGFCNLSKDDL